MGHDATDSYALQTTDPARIHFELECYGNADLDLCLYNPYYDEVVAHWDSFGDEYGSFDVPGYGQDFQLIVVAFNGAGDYDLSLRVDALPFYAQLPVDFTIADGERNSGTATLADDERDALAIERRARVANLIDAPKRAEALATERQRRAAALREALDLTRVARIVESAAGERTESDHALDGGRDR